MSFTNNYTSISRAKKTVILTNRTSMNNMNNSPGARKSTFDSNNQSIQSSNDLHRFLLESRESLIETALATVNGNSADHDAQLQAVKENNSILNNINDNSFPIRELSSTENELPDIDNNHEVTTCESAISDDNQRDHTVCTDDNVICNIKESSVDSRNNVNGSGVCLYTQFIDGKLVRCPETTDSYFCHVHKCDEPKQMKPIEAAISELQLGYIQPRYSNNCRHICTKGKGLERCNGPSIGDYCWRHYPTNMSNIDGNNDNNKDKREYEMEEVD